MQNWRREAPRLRVFLSMAIVIGMLLFVAWVVHRSLVERARTLAQNVTEIPAVPSPSFSPWAGQASATARFGPSVVPVNVTMQASPTITESVLPSPLPTSTPTATELPTPTATEIPTPTATPELLPTPDGVARVLDVPILMYHYISAPPANAGSIRRDLSVSPELFEQHLRYLRDQGYQSITLYDLLLALEIGQPLPPKPIILTFDDGYRDAYTQAFPLLQRYGFVGTFFLITSVIDEQQPEYLTWDQVAEMSAAGMDMEAHGYTHVDLAGRDVDFLVWQVLGAKEAIEARTQKAVRFFCYPSGSYDEQVVRVLRSANYWGAVLISQGVEQKSERTFQLQRLRVRGSYDTVRLAQLINCYMHPEEGSACTSMP